MPEENPEIPQQPAEAPVAAEPPKAVEVPEKLAEAEDSSVKPVEVSEKVIEAPPAQPVEAVPPGQPVEASAQPAEEAPPPKPPRPTPTAPVATESAPAPAKPAAVEAKPLADYLKEDLQPLLLKRLQTEGAADIEITTGEADLTATWDAGDKTFTLYFDEGNLDGRKTIASSQAKSRGKNIQMFMPPERGFKGVDAKTITAMIVTQFTTTLTWIKKPLAKVGKKK
jgi:Protein of unknown function (DUF2996)